MDVQTAIARFNEWCRGQHARNTCLLYESRLRSLSAMFAARELGALTREEVEAWLAAAKLKADGTPKAPDTIRATAIAFMSFQKWAVEYGFLPQPIVAQIKKPMGRMRQRIPKREETEKLLKHATDEFRRIYTALRRTGARPNELCRARLSDWKFDEETPLESRFQSDRVLGDPTRSDFGQIVLEEHKTAKKTGRPRRIDVGRKLATLLLESIGDRTEGAIFLSQTGKLWTPQRLSTVYRELRNASGLPKDLILYLARHEHGTQIYQKLGIFAAKEALGHTDIKTTQRYVHSTPEERSKNQDVFE
jgi:integrase